MTKILVDTPVVERALAALDEIAWSNDTKWQSDRADSVRLALRAALEQQQSAQQPVAWCWTGRKGWIEYGPEEHDLYNCDPLYLHPQPPRQPLSEMEIVELRQLTPGTLDVQFVKFTRAIEAAHGIREQSNA